MYQQGLGLLCSATPGGDEEAAPSKGLFALPFMRRALEKRKAAAQAQAEALLEVTIVAHMCPQLIAAVRRMRSAFKH